MRATRPTLLSLAIVLASTPALLAKSSGDPDHWCGTTRSSLAVALGVHDDHEHDQLRRQLDGGNERDHGKSAAAMT
jgi:hypothetical protein